MMKITYYGHSCFQVEVGGKRLLFDPFITPNPLASHIDIATLNPDFIFLSHGHYDHVADVETIAKASGALLIGCYEVIEWFRQKGIENGHGMNSGGSYDFDFGKVTFTPALHSSSMPDGSYGGVAGGFLITTLEGSFYYSGDTGIFSDMKLLATEGSLTFVALPIGDNFTMGPQAALQVAQWLGCREVIGLHYDTFPPIKIDHALAQKIFREHGYSLQLLSIGQEKEY